MKRHQIPINEAPKPQPAKIAVSDGSVHYGKGAYALIFADSLSNNSYEIKHTVIGRVLANPGTISSLRAEDQGAATSFLHSAFIPERYYSDNEALIDALNSTTPLKPLSPEWDIIEPTRQKVQAHNAKCEHIKGHQDKNTPLESLSTIAKLNITADKMAKQALNLPYKATLTPGHRSTLYINGNPVTTKYKQEIWRAFVSKPLHQYLSDKHHLSTTEMEHIDFDAFAATIKDMKIEQKARIIKLLHDWLPTFSQQNRICKTTLLCSCSQNETTSHLFDFPLTAASKSTFLRSLERKLRAYHTHAQIHRVIMHLARYGDKANLEVRDNDVFYH